MTKIKSNPTPAQCRVLKGLLEEEGRDLYINWNVDSYASPIWHYPYSALNKWATLEYGKPRAATIRRMIEDGLLKNDVERMSIGGMTEEGKKVADWKWVLSDAGREIAEALEDEDLVSPSPLHNTHDLIEVLRKKHPTPAWLFIPELRLGSGWKDWYVGDIKIDSEQRIDAWAMHCWPSKKFLRIAYEVKTTKADFKRELEHPEKKTAAMLVSNLFYFAAPAGIIDPKQLPDQCGLVEIHGNSFSRIAVKAMWRESCDPSWNLIASIGRRL